MDELPLLITRIRISGAVALLLGDCPRSDNGPGTGLPQSVRGLSPFRLVTVPVLPNRATVRSPEQGQAPAAPEPVPYVFDASKML